MSWLTVYPAPKGVPILTDYRVRVRIEPEMEWKELDTYKAKIDMHNVREVSAAYFDFEGKVECEVESLTENIDSAQIRPDSANVKFQKEGNILRFFLERPANLSIEINGNRFNNLHLFAGSSTESAQIVKIIKDTENISMSSNLKEAKDSLMVCKFELSGKNVCASVIQPTEKEIDFDAVIDAAAYHNGQRVICFAPGLHRFKGDCALLPSNTTVILAGGAVVMGGFLIDHKKNVSVMGRGVIFLGHVKRETYLRGVDIRFSQNIFVEGITIINPAHYSIHLGSSENIHIRDIKAFSCVGWSDGIDMMACENVLIEKVFLRNSDDCIAIYGKRFNYTGNTRNVTVRDSVFWADVAHPIMIGVHGDAENGGSILENISFENIDILEHHEPQDDYLGCMAINVGDGNTVQNVSFKNIFVEQFERGKLLDLQVKWNKKYNDVPGKVIRNVVFENIFYSGDGEHTSEINGFSKERKVEGVKFKNLVVRGAHIRKPEDGNIHIGEFAENIQFE